MMPIWFRPILGNLWITLTIRYTLIAGLCLWSVFIQMEYRIPGRFFFWITPLTGLALGLLSFVMLVNPWLAKTSDDNPFKKVFKRTEQWVIWPVWFFIFYGLFVYTNGKLDRSLPTQRFSDILTISRGEINIGWPIFYTWSELRSWENPTRTERLVLNFSERNLWGGEAVLVTTRQGYWGVPWVIKIQQDEEKYYREVLKLAPTASIAWKGLTDFYLDQNRFKEASTTVNDYIKIYPNDYDFAMSVAGILDASGLYSDGIALLDWVIANHPSYEAYQLLGWALSYNGDKKRAAKVLETSIPLNPDDWEAYYHLGYVYTDLGEYTKAIEMFEEVLKRQPQFPEIEKKLIDLKQRPAAQRHAQQSR